MNRGWLFYCGHILDGSEQRLVVFFFCCHVLDGSEQGLVILFRGHMISSFRHSGGLVSKMSKATDSTNGLSDSIENLL